MLERTSSEVVELSAKEREIELARMLSGNPDSTSGRADARELLKQTGKKFRCLHARPLLNKPSPKSRALTRGRSDSVSVSQPGELQ